eukprot:gene6930-30914_t
MSIGFCMRRTEKSDSREEVSTESLRDRFQSRLMCVHSVAVTGHSSNTDTATCGRSAVSVELPRQHVHPTATVCVRTPPGARTSVVETRPGVIVHLGMLRRSDGLPCLRLGS